MFLQPLHFFALILGKVLSPLQWFQPDLRCVSATSATVCSKSRSKGTTFRLRFSNKWQSIFLALRFHLLNGIPLDVLRNNSNKLVNQDMGAGFPHFYLWMHGLYGFPDGLADTFALNAHLHI